MYDYCGIEESMNTSFVRECLMKEVRLWFIDIECTKVRLQASVRSFGV